ncbi:MAG: PPC domain-containing protein [Thermoguttaceae bacterium]
MKKLFFTTTVLLLAAFNVASAETITTLSSNAKSNKQTKQVKESPVVSDEDEDEDEQDTKKEKKRREMEAPNDAKALELLNFKTYRDSNEKVGKYYFVEVPEGTSLLTIWTKSANKGNNLDLYINYPKENTFPSTESYSNAEQSYTNTESFSYTFPPAGIYRIYVSPMKGGCEYDITARFQKPIALKENKEYIGPLDDDGVNGTKHFYFTVPEDKDMLNLWVDSNFEGNGFDIFLNAPDETLYPTRDKSSWKSDSYSSYETIFIVPNAKVPAGLYKLTVLSDRINCDNVKIKWSTENIVELENGETIKRTTRNLGEFLTIDVPKNAKSLKVSTESLTKDNVLNLYMNGPLDEAFPNATHKRWCSETYSANEEIIVEKPKAGKYYIWVSNNKSDKTYFITATVE